MKVRGNKIIYSVCWIALLVLLCGQLTITHAQNTSAADTILVNKLLGNATDSFDAYPEQALAAGQKAIAISEKTGYAAGKGMGLLMVGRLYNKTGEPEKANSNLKAALEISRTYHSEKLECRSLHELGIICDNKKDLNAAFSYFTAALKVGTAARDTPGIAESYRLIGHSFSEQDNFDEAIKNLNRAADLYRSLNVPHDYANLCTNLSATYFNHGDFPMGLGYLYNAIGIYKTAHDTNALSGPYNQLGTYFQLTHKFDSAKYYYVLSLKLAVSAGSKMKEAAVVFSLGGLYDDMGSYGDAESYYKHALSLSRKIFYKRMLYDIPYDLARMYVRMHDYKNAFQYLDTAYYIRDSLYNADNEQTMADMNARYNNNELESRNALLKKDNALKQARLQREEILLYGSLAAVLLLVVIGYQRIRNNKLKANQKLLQVEQKQLLSQMNPHFIFNCLNSIQQYIIQKDAANANKYLADFALLMRQTLDNSKDSAIPLQREIEYLENYLSLERMRFEDKFSYSLTCAGDINKNMVEIPSMIIQPFVENAIHHGLRNLENKAGVLSINFYIKGDSLYCEVDDNGIGMEESQRLKEQRFIKYQSHGMDLTRQRLALVSKINSADYQITVVNKKGDNEASAGTRIIIKFPLKT